LQAKSSNLQWRHGLGVPLVRVGLPYIIAAALLFVATLVIGCPFLTFAAFLATVLVIRFFRDPERTPPDIPHAMVAPADGRVVFAGRVEQCRFLDSAALKISIFMTVFDVHVNRMPFHGQVTGIRYQKGKFVAANKEQASSRNEQNAVIQRLPTGESMAVVQVAGLVARRIDCWVQPADKVQRGQRFGMIRFGSRLDVYLPEHCRLAVTVGQKMKAGESIICYYQKKKNHAEAAESGR